MTVKCNDALDILLKILSIDDNINFVLFFFLHDLNYWMLNYHIFNVDMKQIWNHWWHLLKRKEYHVPVNLDGCYIRYFGIDSSDINFCFYITGSSQGHSSICSDGWRRCMCRYNAQLIFIFSGNKIKNAGSR